MAKTKPFFQCCLSAGAENVNCLLRDQIAKDCLSKIAGKALAGGAKFLPEFHSNIRQLRPFGLPRLRQAVADQCSQRRTSARRNRYGDPTIPEKRRGYEIAGLLLVGVSAAHENFPGP